MHLLIGAEIIYPPEHPYLENTIPSMKAAFDHGADIVELDIQLTKDQILAVFHDYTLEYRTDGKSELKDILIASPRGFVLQHHFEGHFTCNSSRVCPSVSL
ncbi:glycerophosphodiester phosphodiesterase family protein [Bacillus sp. Bva_UNVM-123]|uniref:glycerophosphodiester phosphodiesterase family protein n=1 Tax=Bacillus sp. Bva_UNVM-123 TaxID=2829798 RepID=UPI00391F29AA